MDESILEDSFRAVFFFLLIFTNWWQHEHEHQDSQWRGHQDTQWQYHLWQDHVPVATQRQVQYIDKIDDTIQSMLKHMVEKVEMNTAMLTADIEERADQDERRRNVDDELSDLRRETVSGRQQSPSWTSEAQPGVSTDLNTTSPQTRP